MALWSILLAVTIMLCLVTVVIILPGFLLSEKINENTSFDTGLKYIREKTGESIIYSPHGSATKYVDQYILSSRNKKKLFIGKIATNVVYIEYSVVLFDILDKRIGELTVKELIKKSGYTSELELPNETAYVKFKLNAVNDLNFKVETKEKIDLKQIIIFGIIATLVSFVEIMTINFCIANAFGGIFSASFLGSAAGIIGIIFETLILGAIHIVAAFLEKKYNFRKLIKNVL